MAADWPVAGPCDPVGYGPTVGDCVRLGIMPPPPFVPKPPLHYHDYAAEERRYETQVMLGAVKRCPDCRRWQPMGCFDFRGKRCMDCLAGSQITRLTTRERNQQARVPTMRLNPAFGHRDAFVTPKVRVAI